MTFPTDPGAAARRLPVALLAGAAVVFVWSGIGPLERVTWVMETLPALAGGVILAATYRRFPLSDISYVATFLFAVILMVGGHYTYSEVPAGLWVRDAFDLDRNHFDRLGHVFQGIVPALLARELVVRQSTLRPGNWLTLFSVCVAVSVSAVYEMFEWWYAITFGGDQAESFLGSQGDPWDAQADMLCALVGATLALLLLSKRQQKEIDAIVARTPEGEAASP